MGMMVAEPVDIHSDADQLKSQLPTKQTVINALLAASKDPPTEYEKFLLEWRDLQIESPESNTFLQIRLKALSQAVSYIKEKDHEVLLSYVFDMSFWMHSLDVADALVEFIVNLATVNGGCVAQCLDMLVRNFIPPSSGLPVFFDFFSKRGFRRGLKREDLIARKNEHLERKALVLQKVHSAIKQITELVPMTDLHLQPIVIRRMPHRIIDAEWNALYVENMLWLAKDAGSEYLRRKLLMAVVDRLIEIDVEIRWEDILKEDDSSKVLIFDLECDEIPMEKEDGPGSEAQQAVEDLTCPDGARRQTLSAIANKMDILMDMTLQYLQSCLDAGLTEQVFEILMSSFQSTILDTYKSKFTQFLIFYICSIAPETCGGKFAALLCDILTSPNRAPNTRMSAAAYLASFLARSKYLPLSIVSTSLNRIIDWCIHYSPRNLTTIGPKIDTTVHGVFYSACQAIMYVMCFRMKTCMDDPVQHQVIRNLCINDFLSHVLNPLKLCLPSVVEEFMKQATAAHLVDSKMSLKVNKTMEDIASCSFGGVNRLDMFFPFDPYLLKQSDRFIRPNFIFWSMVESFEEHESSDVEFEGSESDDEEELSDIYSSAKAINTPGSGVSSAMACDSFDDDDEKFIDDFEISLNRMSLDGPMKPLKEQPLNTIPESLSLLQHTLKQPIPLPAKLTPEYLMHFSIVL